MSEKPVLVHLSSKDVDMTRQHEFLRDFFARTVLNLDLIALTDEPSFEFESRFFPGVTLTTGTNSPYSGRTYDISRGNDDFLLVWGNDGGCMRQYAREVESASGAILLYGGDRVNALANRTMSHRTLRVARASLLPVLPMADDALVKPIARNSGAFQLLDEYISFLCRSGATLGPEAGHAVALHICDLMALAIGTTADENLIAQARGGRAARLVVVQRWILGRLRDESLSLRAAADAHQVSSRYIQLLFEEQGTTFSKFVRSNRLALAYRLLNNTTLAHRAISSIAFDSGFSDLSYFNRLFRAAYGATPSDIRHRLLEQHRGG